MLYAAIDSPKHAFQAALPLEEGFWRLGWKPVPHWGFTPQPNAAYAAPRAAAARQSFCGRPLMGGNARERFGNRCADQDADALIDDIQADVEFVQPTCHRKGSPSALSS